MFPAFELGYCSEAYILRCHFRIKARVKPVGYLLVLKDKYGISSALKHRILRTIAQAVTLQVGGVSDETVK
jgi:hypothetical protein